VTAKVKLIMLVEFTHGYCNTKFVLCLLKYRDQMTIVCIFKFPYETVLLCRNSDVLNCHDRNVLSIPSRILHRSCVFTWKQLSFLNSFGCKGRYF